VERLGHLAAVDVPMALADLHRSLPVDAAVMLDFPGATWTAERLPDVVIGAGFVPDELETRSRRGERSVLVRARRARTLPDTVGPGMRLLVCGLNPSVRAADAGVGFVTPGNRFWPAALAAGLVTRDRDPRHALVAHGIGMTDLVKRATPRAAELTRDEYRDGMARLERLCAWLEPGAVCFVGLAGWRAAVDRQATAGPQERLLGGRPAYLMPSTSGLNAATPLAAIVDHLRAAGST
jgi:TDG/mug DNA glycosylase family protein